MSAAARYGSYSGPKQPRGTWGTKNSRPLNSMRKKTGSSSSRSRCNSADRTRRAPVENQRTFPPKPLIRTEHFPPPQRFRPVATTRPVLTKMGMDMARKRKHIPVDYPTKPHNGQARITVTLATGKRHDLYLGKHASPASWAEYERLLALLRSNH